VNELGEYSHTCTRVLQARALTEGLTFISAYDDPYTIAGQGTIGCGAGVRCWGTA
jgi:threonine dehydratase